MRVAAPPAAVIWHDLECGAYEADLPLWRRLASEHPGPVLEIGAGTGRVALDLASHGHRVTALDQAPELLAELRQRAQTLALRTPGISLKTVTGDARTFQLQEDFGLIVVPMQAIQLLGGVRGRAGFLRQAAAHLRPGGRLAVALTERFDLYDGRAQDDSRLPLPDMREVAGILYRSQPTAVRQVGNVIVLERRREMLSDDGRRQFEDDQIHLDRLTAAVLEQEGSTAGLHPSGRVEIPPTSDHVGSVVVLLHG